MMQYKAVLSCICKFMQTNSWHANFSTSICPFFTGKCGKEGKNYENMNILRTKELFRWNKNTFHAGLRQTWKTWKKQSFLWHSGKTWKTQRILEKYFKFLENSGDSVEIDFLIKLLHFLATIYFKWHYSLFTLYTTVIAGFFYLHIYLVWVTGCCLKYSGCVFWDAVIYLMCSYYNILYRLFLFFLFFLILY